MSDLNISEVGLTLLKCLETEHKGIVPYPRLVAYQCQAGRWTIGYGTITYPNGVDVKQGDVCTEEQAEQYLESGLKKYVNVVNKGVLRPIRQQEFDALVCFTYNVGIKGFETSTVLKVVNGLVQMDIENAFIMWNKVDASHDGKDNDGDGLVDELGERKVSQGQINRHMSEAHFYKYGEIKFFS